ncbi:putative sam and ph domain-containing protein [Diaporthe ampelina]|uniref:Putative sam and ph domain-containing protein n=1 Tax=Diaporthe ampelina TaxID=1214573 RepID=A0A0G2G1K4_9PEZI|nr:putative sam and ph domain-containing protein [Diaporthe ampelina]
MEFAPRHTMAERPHREMMEKSHLRETFFSVKNVAPPRPDSVHTEFMETDWEEDDILSELDDGDSSPRLSLDSSRGGPSMTTLSTYDEIRTPEQRSIARFEMGPDPIKPIVGPRGPHLFRSSISSANSAEYENALSLSPITPKVFSRDVNYQMPITLDLDLPTPRAPRDGPFQFTSRELETENLAQWSPEMVAQWMLNAGVELQFSETFVENDINGAILITLKFEDLKELGIASFGVRTKIWEEIHVMKDIRAAAPDPETPIEDEPSREVRKEERRRDRQDSGGELKRRQSSRRRKHPHNEDTIRPGESVSIVGIEQVMPKPHQCSKGENCRKWRKQQRMIEAFKNDHPFVNMESGGVIMVAGDPGNPETARRIEPDEEVVFRPVSDAVPSVVASSDVLGTEGLPPLQYLQQATLRNAQEQQKRDNVRQFLELQNTASSKMNYHSASNPPPRSLSRSTFRRRSFLTMPPVDENNATQIANHRRIPSPITTAQTSPRSQQQRPLQPPPRVQWPWSPPASARQFETAIAPLPNGPGSSSSGSRSSSGQHTPNSSISSGTKIGSPLGGHAKDPNNYQYQGYMKKRKTKMLRHEWHEHYVTLKGTRLAVHKDHQAIDRTLEYVDVDDYAIACSSLASTSKLNAAFKAMSIRKDKGISKEDIAAFSFQLIPQGDIKGGLPKLRKRESSMSGATGGDRHQRNGSWDGASAVDASAPPPPPEAVNGTGKTHHFAVRSRDDRIDWMRELMLAKALRQKGEGFEVSVNGNMI